MRRPFNLNIKKVLNSNLALALGIAVVVVALLIVGAFLIRDQPREDAAWLTGASDSLAIRARFASSPVLSPEESVNSMQIDEGFEVRLVAAEPLVIAPVALTFDKLGRIWVVEMTGYMPDTTGTGEDRATGKIVILEDQNHDGEADFRKVFLDSLVLPRAIALVDDGVLVAEPPNLWFVEIHNDQPGKKILVDDEYAIGGNAEHQPNGLLHGLDNWIYNAKSSKRYKKVGDEWLIEDTHFRGQWGISKDNYGRLFYNHNSANVLGDYFPPGIGVQNENQRQVAGFNEQIVKDKSVYPARPTPGVNRGYRPGVLDERLRLTNMTAACSPLFYRGGLFGKEFDHNAFVAEPAGNLIKRNIIESDDYPIHGRQADSGKEFLASTDERFRPVSLYNGPDGALYIVDMYRGIIQHETYLTDYLTAEIRRRELGQPLNYGRIYKVVPRNKEADDVFVPEAPDELVKLLDHPNGWVRDKAQQMLVEGKHSDVATALRAFLKSPEKPVALVHALWTLEGLGALKAADLLPLLKQPLWPVRMNALSAMPSAMTQENFREYLPVLEHLLLKDSLSAPLIAYNITALEKFDKEVADKLLHKIMWQYPRNEFVADAVISNLENEEARFLAQLQAINPDTNLVVNKKLRTVLAGIRSASMKKRASMLEAKFPKGVALYTSICQTCHGADGNGIKTLAPPLNRSEWVNGDTDKLTAIVLFGLTGPISVNGKLYQAPEISADMPGVGNNDNISDEELAELLSYIRASWRNTAGEVEAADINRVRKKYADREKVFTMQELSTM